MCIEVCTRGCIFSLCSLFLSECVLKCVHVVAFSTLAEVIVSGTKNVPVSVPGGHS